MYNKNYSKNCEGVAWRGGLLGKAEDAGSAQRLQGFVAVVIIGFTVNDYVRFLLTKSPEKLNLMRKKLGVNLHRYHSRILRVIVINITKLFRNDT